ncbi:nitrate reductase cytochrome c-type subunit [Ferrimonas balearica]|uniref:nitrate reductase cytochrome c-type subunit n=1 Tax=Ferrimonas balearica TaxID=44012 RepID=UPI001C993271|nr:nitrate reductase cytochrome c-type subunit [Ferrimonas balearica]MBY5993280.1 nitrate reductase cytochrome c-type subunit [Ferrimonas balearica]
MKKTLSLMALMLALSGCQSGGSEPVNGPQSLRGEVPVAATAPVAAVAQYPSKGTSVAVTSVGQPPVIPHSADYPINLDKNGCISCHRGGKRKMAESHFDDGKVDGKYYQCKACHVPQAENF